MYRCLSCWVRLHYIWAKWTLRLTSFKSGGAICQLSDCPTSSYLREWHNVWVLIEFTTLPPAKGSWNSGIIFKMLTNSSRTGINQIESVLVECWHQCLLVGVQPWGRVSPLLPPKPTGKWVGWLCSASWILLHRTFCFDWMIKKTERASSDSSKQ